MKRVLFSIVLVLSIQFLYSEDYYPFYTDAKFVIADTDLIQLAESKGTYLSYTSDFLFIYLRDLVYNKEGIGLKVGNDTFSIIYIKYNGISEYFKLPQNTDINFSVITCKLYPVVYIKFRNIQSDISSAIVCYDGNGLIIKSFLEEFPHGGEISNDYGYGSLYIEKKEYYLDNFKYDLIYTQNYARIDGKYYTCFPGLKYQRYNYRIKDTNVRLRTKNSTSSEIITVLNNGDGIRLILIDPTLRAVDGNGNWVLVQTENGYIGWVWSKYLDGFSYH